MIIANEMTQSEVEEALEGDMDDQFDAMDYTIDCNTCGQTITDVFRSRDLGKDSRATPSFFLELLAHNMTHYKKPTVLACEDDDIFGVVHTKCNH